MRRNLPNNWSCGAILIVTSLVLGMNVGRADIIITGTLLQAPNVIGSGTTTSSGADVTYTVDGGNFGGFSSVSYASGVVSLSEPGNNAGHFAEVTVNSSVYGSSLGTLNQFLANGSSFNVSSTSGSANNTPYWVITINNAGNNIVLELEGDGSTVPGSYVIDSGSGTSVARSPQLGINSSSPDSLTTLVTQSGFNGDSIVYGNWNVTSVGAQIGDWQGNGETASITGFTLVTAVPEANTMIAAILLLLPVGAGTLHKLRKNRTA